MEIQFTKDTKDIRPNRSKVLKKGTYLECENSLGKEYVRLGVAKEVKGRASVEAIKQIKEVQDKLED